MSNEKIQRIRNLLRELSPEQRRALLTQVGEPSVPMFMWNSNLNGFKAALKYIEREGVVDLVELKNYLRDLGYVQDVSDRVNYGIVYEETGLFKIDSRNNTTTLTSMGNDLAAFFNEDHKNLTIFEKLICRGLQQLSSGYTYLHIVGQNPGITRKELVNKLVQIYGGKGRYFAGYYTRLFNQLELIAKERKGREVTYCLTVPEIWGGEPPEMIDDEATG